MRFIRLKAACNTVSAWAVRWVQRSCRSLNVWHNRGAAALPLLELLGVGLDRTSNVRCANGHLHEAELGLATFLGIGVVAGELKGGWTTG
jgi:selenocysteine lyase/cysteine desulfurase